MQPGDTLSQIAEGYGVTTDDLYEYKPGVDEYILMPGNGIVYGPGDDGVFDDSDDFEEDDETAGRTCCFFVLPLNRMAKKRLLT
ncbi:LysM peptidoglycan-binding domain-containing protein [Planococcus lenghuensis]|uniref:Uncharacterized protein n=1 Tax=Planococcus lenghuensis TaxID=2213202 RepID=A0A1Q2KYY8_9BACL|nr:LysM domain-containing protein [Planococcus lenghuensis]AQQ53418.1 hypothetical protein B0X71_10260 [Planococcus lenghuensis]